MITTESARIPRGLLVFAIAAACVLLFAKVATQRRPAPIPRTADTVAAEDLPRIPAPPFTLPARGGGTVELARLRGKVVLVNFWASWCPPCRAEEPSLRTLAQSLQGDSFEVVAVSVDDSWAEVDKFFGQIRPPYRVALDKGGTVSQSWGTTKLPESYLIDATGTLRLKFVGPRDWNDPGVRALVRSFMP